MDRLRGGGGGLERGLRDQTLPQYGRDAGKTAETGGFRVPGHPFTTLAFVTGSWLVVLNTIYRFPTNALAGVGLLALGVPVYLYWRRDASR